MALPELTPEIESTIRTGHALGTSQAAIARQLNVRQEVVSRWAKRIGIVWNISPNVAAMTDQVRQRIANERAHLAELALASAINLHARVWDEYELVVSTPDGPERVTLELPDAKAVNDFTKAVDNLVKTHENMTRIGAGTSADHAKSMLVQMQRKLLEAVQAEEGDE